MTTEEREQLNAQVARLDGWSQQQVARLDGWSQQLVGGKGMKLVYLYFIATLSTSGGVKKEVFQMPNMDVCLAAVSAAQVHVPSAGDAETTVSLFCAGPEK